MAVRLVAFFRGINVGRAKRVAMADLRELLEDLGYRDVATYLNSGNAVLTSTKNVNDREGQAIESALSERLGVRSFVVFRTLEEMESVVKVAPMLDRITNPSRYLVGFLEREATASAKREIEQMNFEPNQIRFFGREVYLWCPKGVIGSPFSTIDWQRRLGTAVTMRNWNTVNKLLVLARSTR